MHITEILLGKVRAPLIEDTLRVISVMWHYYCAFGTICTPALGSDSGPQGLPFKKFSLKTEFQFLEEGIFSITRHVVPMKNRLRPRPKLNFKSDLGGPILTDSMDRHFCT